MLIVNIIGVLLIVLIAWWFWFSQAEQVLAQGGAIDVEVSNGSYSPANITIEANKPFALHVKRLDPSPCAEMLQIPKLDINETLKVNERHTITLPPLEPGEYAFHCQMQMYRGTINVVEQQQ